MSDIAVLFFFIFMVVSAFVIGFVAYHGGYEQGQIDAINGIIKYELVAHPDKTQTWELKEKK